MQEDSRFPRPPIASPWGTQAEPPPRDDGNPAMVFVLALFMFIGLLEGLFVGWLIWG